MSRKATAGGGGAGFPKLGRFVAPILAVLAPLALALPLGCDDDSVRGVRERFWVVGGEPRVDPALPSVEIGEGAGQGDYAPNAPVQLDTFLQQPVGKIDILWVIDNSWTMQARQAQVRANFRHFIESLTDQDEPVDFHIGVVTTDADNPKDAGVLRRPPNLAQRWIDSENCRPPACDAVAVFDKLADVGTTGSGDEKGLLAAMRALSPPLSAPGGANHGFLRDDARLVVVILSDEEDSSCAPIRSDYGGGCGTAPSFDNLSWGHVDYFVRFFEGLKGQGGQDLVKVEAIVATEQSETFDSRVGCRPAGGTAAEKAIYAPRYVEVARRTGGLAESICRSDYSEVLKGLGKDSGARVAFPLSRRPYEDSLRVFVVPQGGARAELVRGTHFTYTGCSQGSFVNVIRFMDDHIPAPMTTVEIEYAVNVREAGCSPAP